MYHDLVPDARIVTAYTVSADGRRVSISLATAEFTATVLGTRLTLTDQGAYLDGLDTSVARRSGTTPSSRHSVECSPTKENRHGTTG